MMNVNTKISMIIPCFNVEQYIERCYASLAIQKDAEDIEFIFVNDGSTDNTLHLLNQFKDKDKRVVVIDQPNAGVSAARNRALEIAKGNYFFLLDSDDYLPENTISYIKDVINKHCPDIIMPAYNNVIGSAEILVKLPLEDGLYNKHSFFKSVKYFPTKPQLIYKNKSVKFNAAVKCGEVYAFTISYLQYAQTIYVLNTPCYNYFQRPNSATSKCNYKNDSTVIDAIEPIYQHGKDLSKYSSFIVTAFKLYMSFTYNKYIRFPSTSDAIDVVKKLLSTSIIRKNLKEVIFRPHFSFKERCLACYVYFMPKLIGFKLLNKIFSKQ